MESGVDILYDILYDWLAEILAATGERSAQTSQLSRR